MGEHAVKCPHCGKVITDKSKFIAIRKLEMHIYREHSGKEKR